MTKYIDTHGHLNSKEFSNNLENYIKEANDIGVQKIIIPGTSKKDSLQAIEISKKFNNVYAMVSLHPNNAKSIDEISWIDNIDPKNIVGVGECGLDLYWKNNPPLAIQSIVFKKHLDYAKKHKLPVVIHTRNAEQETYDIVNQEKYSNLKYVIHCSTMSKDWVLKFAKIGAYISFSGIVTFKKTLDIKEAAKAVPLNKLLTETDAPYLAPEPVRGKMNKPMYVKYVTDYVAKIRCEDDESVKKVVYENALKVFNIK